ncbi:MAG: hypothetical protein HN833_02600 [Elusimicrobiaceae bacterium]|jgi:hypothetical protein|nr:hypothetical protein [Elusimicrobiaceae bacterium]MBT3955159.1 hypothetical protein [Elusimicrobiaceae bacterium]MBT4008688.1 hypothetical protein [Elusimicrobiaceae bacterium]MBT4402486.1 hypothetical protein [Elusimicrobiaceae bacterium]MBT4440150.1 hypothetical protein [Elusimicrobiaceae bacterium]
MKKILGILLIIALGLFAYKTHLDKVATKQAINERLLAEKQNIEAKKEIKPNEFSAPTNEPSQIKENKAKIINYINRELGFTTKYPSGWIQTQKVNYIPRGVIGQVNFINNSFDKSKNFIQVQLGSLGYNFPYSREEFMKDFQRSMDMQGLKHSDKIIEHKQLKKIIVSEIYRPGYVEQNNMIWKKDSNNQLYMYTVTFGFENKNKELLEKDFSLFLNNFQSIK